MNKNLKKTATGDELRAKIPMDAWLPFHFHLIDLNDGMLTIAPLYDAEESHLRILFKAIEDRGFFVKDIDLEIWDRERLYLTLQDAHSLVFDRPNKFLVELVEKPTDKEMALAFWEAVLKEALQQAVSVVSFHYNRDKTSQEESPCCIYFESVFYKEKEKFQEKEMAYALPKQVMWSVIKALYKKIGVKVKSSDDVFQTRFLFDWFEETLEIKLVRTIIDDDKKEIRLYL